MGFCEYWVQWVGGSSVCCCGARRRLPPAAGHQRHPSLLTNLFLLAVGLSVVAYARTSPSSCSVARPAASALGYAFRVLLLGDRDALAPLHPSTNGSLLAWEQNQRA